MQANESFFRFHCLTNLCGLASLPTLVPIMELKPGIIQQNNDSVKKKSGVLTGTTGWNFLEEKPFRNMIVKPVQNIIVMNPLKQELIVCV